MLCGCSECKDSDKCNDYNIFDQHCIYLYLFGPLPLNLLTLLGPAGYVYSPTYFFSCFWPHSASKFEHLVTMATAAHIVFFLMSLVKVTPGVLHV